MARQMNGNLVVFTLAYILATCLGVDPALSRKIDGINLTSGKGLQTKLQDLTRTTSGQHLMLLEIENIHLKDSSLPLGLFKGSKIRQIIFRNVNLKEACPPGESPFDGLQESLESIAFLGLTISKETQETHFGILSGFKNLKTIIMSRSSTDLFTFTGNFAQMLDIPLTRIMVTASRIEKVPGRSLESFAETLEELVLEGCDLEKAISKWFGVKVMKVLRRINLSSNKLQTVNEDFFKGMPKLKEVDLQDNRLFTIIDESSRPTFSSLNLTYLGLYDTKKLECDKTAIRLWDWLIAGNDGITPPFYERPFRVLPCSNGTAVKHLRKQQRAQNNYPMYAYSRPNSYSCQYLRE